MHADPEFSRPELSALLAAASAPGEERELAGEEAMLWQFRAARTVAQPRRRPRTSVKAAIANALAAKVALASAAAVAATGGVVLAAATGHWTPNAPVYIAGAPTRPAPPSEAVGPGSAPRQSWPARPSDGAAPSVSAEPSRSGPPETAPAGRPSSRPRHTPAAHSRLTSGHGKSARGRGPTRRTGRTHPFGRQHAHTHGRWVGRAPNTPMRS